MATRVKVGDVLRYTPAQRHCREGTALVHQHGVAIDTYWRPEGDSESHRLTGREMATAIVVFNVGEFDALDRYSSSSREVWETYAPDDRAQISSQRGLQGALFIRKGATPHLGTQIENARAAVAKAEAASNSALTMLKQRQDELSALEACALNERVPI